MSKRRTFLIFGLSIVLLCAVSARIIMNEENSFLSIPLINENEWNDILSARSEGGIEYELFFDGSRLPLYTSGSREGFLLSQSGGTWSGSLGVTEGYKIALLDNGTADDIGTAAEEMSPLSFVVYDDSHFVTGNIFVSLLPVMVIETDEGYADAEDRSDTGSSQYGTMTLFSTAADGTEQVISTGCSFHVRGNASVTYYKVGYKLNLLDGSGETRDESLLGMRSDDDWILRAMGLDNSKIREKLATDLWNEISDFGTYRAEYIELFIDSEYQGLYLLQEPMDFNTLNLDSDDNFLIQVYNWSDSEDFWQDLLENGTDKLECGEFVINRRNSDNLEEVYEVLCAYKKMLEGGDTGDVRLTVDEDSFALMEVFLMFITGVDNAEKNQFLVFSRQDDGSWLVRKLPWDFDATLGQGLDHLVYESFDSIDTGDLAVDVLLEMGYGSLGDKISSLYSSLREDTLTVESLYSAAEELYSILDESGAIIRENESFGKDISYDDTVFVEEFMIRRLTFLDEFYGYQ